MTRGLQRVISRSILTFATIAFCGLAFANSEIQNLDGSHLCQRALGEPNNGTWQLDDSGISIKNIKSVYQRRMKIFGRAGDISVDGRRLLSRYDWLAATHSMPGDPWNYYGRKTFSDWLNAKEFSRSKVQSHFDVQLLVQIHKIATKNHYFQGVEKRLVEQAYRNGEISSDEYGRLKDAPSRGEQIHFGESHEIYGGRIRSLEVEHFSGFPDSWSSKPGKQLSSQQLQRLRENPDIFVSEKNGNWIIETHPVEQTQDIAIAIIDDMNNELQKSETDMDVLMAIAKMEIRLISLHPFLDGNGRSIRLFRDMVLESYGFPPPLYPNEDDIYLKPFEMVEYYLRSMTDYLKSSPSNYIFDNVALPQNISESNLNRDYVRVGILPLSEKERLMNAVLELPIEFTLRMSERRLMFLLKDKVIRSHAEFEAVKGEQVGQPNINEAVEDLMFSGNNHVFGTLGLWPGPDQYGSVIVRIRPQYWQERSWATDYSGGRLYREVALEHGVTYQEGVAIDSDLLKEAAARYSRMSYSPRDYKRRIAQIVIERFASWPGSVQRDVLNAVSHKNLKRLRQLLGDQGIALEAKISGSLPIEAIESVLSEELSGELTSSLEDLSISYQILGPQ